MGNELINTGIDVIGPVAWGTHFCQFYQTKDDLLDTPRRCTGLSLSGNTFWLERQDWKSFTDYEAAINDVIGRYRMLALCTYSLDKCGAAEP